MISKAKNLLRRTISWFFPAKKLSKKAWAFRAASLGIIFIIVFSILSPLAGRQPRVLATTFTASGNWTVPAGTTYAVFEAWGGGGGGGGGTGAGSAGYGGAGGQYAKKSIVVTPNDSYSVVVGAGGQRGDFNAFGTGIGQAGGDSYVTSPSSTTTVLAKGGAGGVEYLQGGRSLGTTSGGIGDIIYAGGDGGDVHDPSSFGANGYGGGGGGGAGSSGEGGDTLDFNPGTGTALNGGNGGTGGSGGSANGNPGSTYGGGGGGGTRFSGNIKIGGDGAQGLVVITAYTTPVNGVGGQTKLYLHKENSDIFETYNNMGVTPPEPAADTLSSTTSTATVNATPPTAFCESSANTSDKFNDIGADTSNFTNNYCMATFISSPLDGPVNMTTSDTANITGQFWSSESASQVTAAMNIYIYKYSGSSTVTSTNRLATLTCSDPGTAATSCAPTAAAPANNLFFSAGDRIAAIVSMNVTAIRAGSNVQVYFDSTARTASFIKLGYTFYGNSSANKPGLAGTFDDDFTTDSTTTACTTGGVIYHTKWTCLQGSAANTTGNFNAAGTSGTINGDSSGWLWVQNKTSTTAAVPCNFNANSSGSCATPSNTYIYQTLPASYTSGNVTTLLNSSVLYDIGSTPTNSGTPYSHSGLVLWTSNSDYLEVQVYSDSAINDTGTNNVKVALNTNGTLSGATSLNTATSNNAFSNIWLRFVNTAGSYQAQYSTDGTSFTNVGSAVSHSAFTRVGLNAYAAIANPVMSYAGAFEWFSSTIASSSNAAPAAPTLITPSSGGTGVSTTPSFTLRTTDANNDYLDYRIYIYQSDCSTAVGASPFDQNASQTGWSGQDANTNTAYVGSSTLTSSTIATYTYQGSLSPNTTYCWKADAKDPGGSNTFSTASATQNFTTGGPTTDQQLRGGTYFSNGTKQPIYWAQ